MNKVEKTIILLHKYANKLPCFVSEEHYRFFDNLTAFYLEGRYPEHTQKLSEIIKEQEASEIFTKTEEVLKWLMTLKP